MIVEKEKIALTPEEEKEIRDIQQIYNNLILNTGELALKRTSLQLQIDILDEEIKKNWKEVQNLIVKEKEILTKLDSKYGLKNLNM